MTRMVNHLHLQIALRQHLIEPCALGFQLRRSTDVGDMEHAVPKVAKRHSVSD